MAAHWGTFTKGWNYREVLSTAADAVTAQGLSLYNQANDGDYIVIGGGEGDLIVQITCVPQADKQTWVAVTSWASDSATAERARNEIRERIVRLVHID